MVANLTARGIDVAALDELALDGFNIVADSRELLSDIARTNRLDLPLPPNNAFFYWQMSQRHCAAGATAKCNGRRWDDYLDSEVIRKLKAELRLVVMQYLSSVGIDGADVPEFEVRTWANVQSAVSPRPLADGFYRWAASSQRLCLRRRSRSASTSTPPRATASPPGRSTRPSRTSRERCASMTRADG